MKSEGELVSFFRRYLIRSRWTVLLARPNQGSLFFHTPSGRKAPDIVAKKMQTILILEAKWNSVKLFNKKAGQMSDCESMQYLFENEKAKMEIFEKLSLRFKIRLSAKNPMICGLLSATPFSECNCEIAKPLVCLEANLETAQISITNMPLQQFLQ